MASRSTRDSKEIEAVLTLSDLAEVLGVAAPVIPKRLRREKFRFCSDFCRSRSTRDSKEIEAENKPVISTSPSASQHP